MHHGSAHLTAGHELAERSRRGGGAAPRLSILLAISLFGAARVAAKTNAHHDAWGKLEVALLLTHHLDGGTDLLFALYSSGRVLYLHPMTVPPWDRNYDVVTLSAAERKALVGDLPLGKVGQFHPSAHQGDDGSTSCIEVWSDGAHHHDCKWGGMNDKIADTHPSWPRTPPGMLEIWRKLLSFRSERAKPWIPDHINVTLEKYAEWNCGEPAASPWPGAWPHPTPATSTTDPQLVGRLVLPGSALPALQELETGHTSKRCRRPMELDGALYAVFFETPFPSEDAWKAEAEARQ